MKPVHKHNAAFSMLELIVATAMLTTVMTSVVVLVRTSYTAWELHEQDLERMENAYATLRHIVRNARQAESVVAISDPSDITGQLTLLMPSGESRIWQRQEDDIVYYGIGSATDPLATFINELTFIGYQADGVTQTTIPDKVQLIECRVKTVLPHCAGEDRIVRCKAWLRSW